ncbi:hypothetical protein N1851_015415 [Merluccius polli]|uniref:Uncharacterized protein n=1 Tax=Merluccius polli TaxID=89951 RepID=A0AA47MSA7_MERPO|nr:hypothetical protein N1851_029232 [Merluccius polli]KAK0145693.1 hypothetical protein N1851_015415 [Merluccius polli]
MSLSVILPPLAASSLAGLPLLQSDLGTDLMWDGVVTVNGDHTVPVLTYQTLIILYKLGTGLVDVPTASVAQDTVTTGVVDSSLGQRSSRAGRLIRPVSRLIEFGELWVKEL